MKKTLTLVIAAVLIMILAAGCSKKEPEAPKDYISPKALTEDQQAIVDLLSNERHEIMLFEYKSSEVYKKAEFWVETYEYGELTDSPSGIIADGKDKPLDGQLAVHIYHDTYYQWSFNTSEDGSRTSHTSEPFVIDDETLARGFGPMSDPAVIEDGQEIVLYTSVFSSNRIRSYIDMQRYVTEPDLLKEYPYAHIIKCRFTK